MVNYLNRELFDLGAECQQDAQASQSALRRKADYLATQYQETDFGHPQKTSRGIALAKLYRELAQQPLAWETLYPLLDACIMAQRWQDAVEVCEGLYLTEQPGALVALGHSLWLSVTFPIDPALTLCQLQYVIDETPQDADGAAVAAAVAAYIVDLRCVDAQHDDTTLTVGRMFNDVARRHSGISGAEQFDHWVKRMELDQPDKFLPRLRNIIDVLVQDDWWFDRHHLQRNIPV